MLARSFLIESSSKLLVTRTGIKARSSLILDRIRPLILELLALEWQTFYTFELEYLWSWLAYLDQILCVASLGWGKGCIRFWGRLDQNSGFHGNRKPPLTYNGKMMSPILFILAGNEGMHKISNEFEFWPDRTSDYGVSCPWASKKFPIDLQWENGVSMLAHSFLIESSSKLLVTRIGIKARTSSILGLWFPWPIYMFFEMRFDLGTLDSGERSLPFWATCFKRSAFEPRHEKTCFSKMRTRKVQISSLISIFVVPY